MLKSKQEFFKNEIYLDIFEEIFFYYFSIVYPDNTPDNFIINRIPRTLNKEDMSLVFSKA